MESGLELKKLNEQGQISEWLNATCGWNMKPSHGLNGTLRKYKSNEVGNKISMNRTIP
jgi:hypothetical protein